MTEPTPWPHTLRLMGYAFWSQIRVKRGTWWLRKRGFRAGLRIAWGMAKAYHYVLRGQHVRKDR